VITFRALDDRRTQIASPFGGIVYIVVAALPNGAARTLTLRFDGFVAHPLADVRDPAAGERTRDVPLPWGELVTSGVVFTLPAQSMRGMDFALVDRQFAAIVGAVREYLAVEYATPYRFIFDVELPPEPSGKYPLFFLISDIALVMENWGAPSAELFQTVVLICSNSMREDVLDPRTELAVVAVAAAVAVRRLFPAFDPLGLEAVAPPDPLFRGLWEIQQSLPRAIPDALAAMSESRSRVESEMWIAFVQELCKTGQRDFTPLLEQSRPIPLNLSQSLQGLPRFVAEAPP
jgi:hypothetical protein